MTAAYCSALDLFCKATAQQSGGLFGGSFESWGSQSICQPHPFKHKQSVKAGLRTGASQAAVGLHPSAALGPYVSM